MTGGPPDDEKILEFRRRSPEVQHDLVEERCEEGWSSSDRHAIPWVARLTLALPEGVSRHPRLLDRVRDEMGRPCAIDIAHHGIAVAYTARGETFERACDDSTIVCDALVDSLHLSEDAVEEHVLIATDGLPTWPLFHGPDLEPVPDQRAPDTR